MNWKTIDKLEAKVPGADTYRGEWVTFDVRLGRSTMPLRLSGEDDERFRIENTEFDIAVEATTLQEAKALLREKLATSEDYSGTWKLWMKIDVSGGYDESWNGESATCTISVAYVLELTTGKGNRKRKRHIALKESLPHPFVGEFTRPTTHAELSRLSDGAACPPRNDRRRLYDKEDVWVEATPEIVETIRMLQRRLGESGDNVKAALSKKRFLETLASVRSGNSRLIGGGPDAHK